MQQWQDYVEIKLIVSVYFCAIGKNGTVKFTTLLLTDQRDEPFFANVL